MVAITTPTMLGLVETCKEVMVEALAGGRRATGTSK
jgi:hypothetical protein